MKKKLYWNITISIVLVAVFIFVVSSFSANFIKSKEVDTRVLASSDVDITTSIQNQKTKITKTESKDYYTYAIIDYERGLNYSWQFQKEADKNISIEDSLYIDEDLRLSLNADTTGANRIEDKVDQKKLIVSFDYHGTLPLKTTVTIDVRDKFKDGESLYLYYYNPDNDTIEYIMKDVKVNNGLVSFEIEHCSDYFLTAAVVNDAVNNPQSVNYIIIGLVVVVFILIAITLKQSKK